jgi:glycine hydroxymethyltransferase
MDHHRQLLAANDPEIEAAIAGEEQRQRDGIELIPSENYTCPEVLAALGTVLTNKYSEGYPGRRYYGGQQFTDEIEEIARARAQALFRAEHANVQPLSGSAMNQAAYLACLQPGDTVLAMDLSHGGHLTHGAPVSHMGRLFNFVRYRTQHNRQGAIDYDGLLSMARETRPKLVLCGFSSYPRELDYAAFRRIADSVGALAMADIAHIGGLVAAGVLRNPLDDGFDIVTTTVHKSLRGPRAGLILCRAAHAGAIDASVFPGLQGGPHMHTIAATAVALRKAAEPAFRDYARQILANAQALAAALQSQGVELVTGGTDNHLLVLNTIDSFGIDGRRAEQALDAVGIAANKQVVPDDPNPPLRPSGLRIGTPAATTRGMREADMRAIAAWMVDAMRHSGDAARLSRLADEVRDFCRRFPLPGVSPQAA